MAKIIGVIQVKGGAGRSTVATNIAGELAKIGRTVLIDGDMPQGTSASWYAMQGAGREGGGHRQQPGGRHRSRSPRADRQG
jgi:cellulose biosynthesis protein BcsQ